MIDRDAALIHHFFGMSQAQRIGHLPAYARQHYVEWIGQVFEYSGHCRIQRRHQAFTSHNQICHFGDFIHA